MEERRLRAGAIIEEETLMSDAAGRRNPEYFPEHLEVLQVVVAEEASGASELSQVKQEMAEKVARSAKSRRKLTR